MRCYFLRLASGKRHLQQGLTILELLITLVIVGILGATALPILAKQTQNARATEAATNLGVIDRAQQAFYIEQGQFASHLNHLDVKISANTYRYSVTLSPAGFVKHQAQVAPGRPHDIKEYVSGVTRQNKKFLHLICKSYYLRKHPDFVTPGIQPAGGKLLCVAGRPLS